MEYYVIRQNEILNDELMHYGVPGMKWGRRKAMPISSGTGRSGGRTSVSTSAKRVTKTNQITTNQQFRQTQKNTVKKHVAAKLAVGVGMKVAEKVLEKKGNASAASWVKAAGPTVQLGIDALAIRGYVKNTKNYNRNKQD